MENAIKAHNIKRYFKSGDGTLVHALDGVSLEIKKQSLAILKGRSGSGKTTLLNILSALDMPTEEKTDDSYIIFENQKLSDMSAGEKENLRRYKMGFVFQSIALIPVMNAYENVEFALRLAGYKGDKAARTTALLERVGLGRRMDHMPGQLSGGEQQRVAIARAVAHHPDVIFADEPTGALDTASGLEVMKLFREIIDEEKVTIVMTTHDQNLMQLGDAVFELQDGKIK